MNMAMDLESPHANSNGTVLEAVTKDQLEHRLPNADSPRVGEEPVRLPVWREASGGATSWRTSSGPKRSASRTSRRRRHELVDASPTAPRRLRPAMENYRIDPRKNLREQRSHGPRVSTARGIVLEVFAQYGHRPAVADRVGVAAINTVRQCRRTSACAGRRRPEDRSSRSARSRSRRWRGRPKWLFVGRREQFGELRGAGLARRDRTCATSGRLPRTRQGSDPRRTT